MTTIIWRIFDEEDEEYEQSAFLIFIAATATLNQRSTVIKQKEVDWSCHVEKLLKEGTFHCTYQMIFESFYQLVDMAWCSINITQTL